VVLAGSLLLIACEGRVGEFGDDGAPQQVGDPRSERARGGDLTCSASSVATREAFTCTAEARHPTQEAAALHAGAGEGFPAIQLGDCSTAITTPRALLEPRADAAHAERGRRP